MNEEALNTLRERMGLVFQFGALFDSLNVAENVGFRLYEHTNMTDEQVNAAIDEKLHLVGLPGMEKIMPAECSGGMQKRVGIARALIGNPSICSMTSPPPDWIRLLPRPSTISSSTCAKKWG